ncbi:MAG: hypothetical protein LBB36_04485 [Fibromonadaceae bacterium]|jgi:hypothetical protein|nr:hypothetical protein [Fibromonadaceae bacterium]
MKKFRKFYKLWPVLLLAMVTTSCTHWLIETETRVRMKNDTADKKVCCLSLVSQEGQTLVLVPETLNPGESSKKAYEYELVGKFNFAVYSGGIRKDLDVHSLKGGVVEAKISENDGKFTMELN